MTKSNNQVIILGAGPAGLAAAYELIAKKTGLVPIIIEKLDCVGGLSRTVYNDGSGVDIGGHRLYTDNEYIKSIWNTFLSVQNSPSIDDILTNRKIKYPKNGKNPEKDIDVMLIRQRHSSIIYNSKFFTYPIEFNLNTFLNLGLLVSFKCGISYLKSIFFKRKENNLEDFMINRFGYTLYEIFFKDYTKKVWGVDASLLSSQWGNQRIRKLSLFKTILNSILSKFNFLKFKKETSLIDKFYYPKYGCSELWNLMANYIVKNGGKIILNSEFESFELQDNNILSVNFKSIGNKTNQISGKYFISSIPLKDLIMGIDSPYDIKQTALNLPYRDYILVSFYVDNFNLKNKTKFPTVNNIIPDCWIYLQEKSAIASRIQIMNNWSPYLVKDFKNKYLISLEYFVFEDDTLWNKDDNEITNIAFKECIKYNLFSTENVIKSYVIREKKAYPSYYGAYKNIDRIKDFLLKQKNLFLIGRNGQHEYNNMDEAMLSGIRAVRDIIIKNG